MRLNNEARADETSMIPFGAYSPECVEEEFSEVHIEDSAYHGAELSSRDDNSRSLDEHGEEREASYRCRRCEGR